jgi:hypothetical protein
VKITVQISVLAILLFGLVGASAEEQPWDAVPHMRCSDVVTPGGEFTAKTPFVFTWLVGYIDGLSAPSVLDKRLQTISNAGSQQVAPLVLAFCMNKQDDTLITATTGVAEMLINAQPGRRVLNLQLH